MLHLPPKAAETLPPGGGVYGASRRTNGADRWRPVPIDRGSLVIATAGDTRGDQLLKGPDFLMTSSARAGASSGRGGRCLPLCRSGTGYLHPGAFLFRRLATMGCHHSRSDRSGSRRVDREDRRLPGVGSADVADRVRATSRMMPSARSCRRLCGAAPVLVNTASVTSVTRAVVRRYARWVPLPARRCVVDP